MIRVVLFTLFFPIAVLADARVNDLQALVPGMIDFIESRGVNSYNGAPYPKILIANEKEICTGAYGKPMDVCDIAGYYNDITNTIYIRDKPSRYMTDDRFQEVVLVHELVHFLQNFSGTYQEVECKQQLEVDAYEVQGLYIDLMGIDPKQKPDPLFAVISSLCPSKWPLFFEGG